MISNVQRIAACGFVLLTGAFSFSLNAADEPATKVPEKSIQKFKELDRDSDGLLSIDEYVAQRDPVGLYQRDFKLFDLNHDNSLTLVEFSPIAGGVHGNVRGPIPDPLVKLVDQITADMDVRLKNWNKRASNEIILAEFAAALPEKLTTALNSRLLQEADANRNGQVSRSEARRFLEIQLGLRLPDGRPLRMPNGRVNNYSYFLHLDRNQSEQIELAEFTAQTGGDELLQKRFAESDRNGDGVLTQDEWFISTWTYYDPVDDFRYLDADLDGFLSDGELIKRITDWRKTGVKHLVRAFDVDQDGKMSIDEYRLTPLANIVLAWQKMQTDEDQDQKLAITEFVFDQPFFPMLRAFYFRRFDLNQDGYLDLTEYEFKTLLPFEMYALNSDGTGLKKLDVGKNVRFGSPAVSPDSRWIAFDGASTFNTDFQNWQIQVMPVSGGDPKEICDGVQPTWSADGLKLACCRFQPMHGIWIVGVTGSEKQFVSSGWGTQWSPDGKKVFFTAGNSMRLYDVAKNEIEVLLNREQHEYSSFEMNATWSPDSRRICANARRVRTSESSDVVVVDTTAKDNDKIKVRLSGKQIGSDFAWHPDGNRIVFVMLCEERNRRQLYEFDPDDANGVMTLVPGQAADKTAIDVTWTPDGKKLIYTVSDDN